ncbi:MAG: capsular biosynthesis protein [Bacteroidetes bacterium]|nr:capsular biosynthesis protein [Bacteroidota bacterium]
MDIWGNLFSQKSSIPLLDYSALTVDMHSHLIPGLDDGSASAEESLEMLKGLASMGFRKIITTPHVMVDYYKNTPEHILAGLKVIRQAAGQQDIRLEIEAAAEYMLDDGFEKKFHDGQLMTFGKKNILIELSTFTPHPNLFSILFDLQIAGYKTILAHVERYAYWYDKIDHYEELKDREILLQVNILSFGGHYGPVIKKMAEKLADRGLIDVLGTDMHNPLSIPAYQKTLKEKYIQRLLSSGKLLNPSL